MTRILTTTAAAALLLAACTMNNQQAAVESGASVSATVAAVDPQTRKIDLTTAEGETITLTATPEMRNFDQIEPGDVATLEIYGSIQVQVAGPGELAAPQTFAVFGRAPEGAKPGAVAGMSTTTHVRFVSYNPATFEASIILPDGAARTVTVEPGMRAFAAARTPGERLEVTFSDAIALMVDPA